MRAYQVDPKMERRLREGSALTSTEIHLFTEMIGSWEDEEQVWKLWTGWRNSFERNAMYRKIERYITDSLKLGKLQNVNDYVGKIA